MGDSQHNQEDQNLRRFDICPENQVPLITHTLQHPNKDSFTIDLNFIDEVIAKNVERNLPRVEALDLSGIARNQIDDKKLMTMKPMDRLLPVFIVGKSMRDAVPTYAKISEESRIIVRNSASEFVSFLVNEAVEHPKSERRLLLTANDIIEALKTLGFDNYVSYATDLLQKIKAMHANDPEMQQDSSSDQLS